MAEALPEAEVLREGGGGGGLAAPGPSGNSARLAPLDPEQLRRVLERVTKAQPPPSELRDAAQPPRPPPPQVRPPHRPGAFGRLSEPEGQQQLEAGCVKVSPGSTHRQQRPTSPLVTVQPQAARLSPPPGRLFSVASPQLPGAGALLSTRLQPCLLTGPQHPLQVLVRRPLPALQPLSAERGLTPAAHLPAVTPSSSSSADDFVASTHTKHPEKPKRPLRVKTRSGRVSRPPKHKAKDYKFIKTEDLADGHPSDSDDYSELSLEEEEEPGDKQGLFEASCSLRPKAFKCQACDKRYIGKGGLARHFKLNPSHGHLEPEIVPPGRAGDRAVQDHKEARTGAPAPPEVFTPALGGEEGAPSARSGLQLLQQRSRGDLVELALPRLAQAVTVYEFLLVKVEKGYPAKPLFPAVYKEFEELHAMVKNLCRDYLSSASPHSLEPLRINNSKVAESLGITGELLRRNERHPDGVPPTGTCHEGAGWELEQPGPQKRGCQNMEPDLAALKRARSGPLSRDGTQPCVHSASRQKPLSGPAARTNGSVSRHPPGAAVPLPVADFEARAGYADITVPYRGVSGLALSPELGEPGTLAQKRVAAFPEENAQGPLPDQDTGHSLQSGGVYGSLLASRGAGPLAPGSSVGTAGDLHRVQDSPSRGPSSSPSDGLHSEVAEKFLSPDVQPGNIFLPQPGQLSADGQLRSLEGDPDSDQMGLGHIVATGEAWTLETTTGGPGPWQDKEMIATRTLKGLLLSPSGSLPLPS